MRIFYSVKYHEDGHDRFEIEAILKMLEALGYDTFCVVRDVERWGQVSHDEGQLMRLTLQAIRNSHWILVNLGEKGIGLGIEAGYAHARGIPIAVIAPHAKEISATLRGIASATCNYRSEVELQDFLAGLRMIT